MRVALAEHDPGARGRRAGSLSQASASRRSCVELGYDRVVSGRWHRMSPHTTSSSCSPRRRRGWPTRSGRRSWTAGGARRWSQHSGQRGLSPLRTSSSKRELAALADELVDRHGDSVPPGLRQVESALVRGRRARRCALCRAMCCVVCCVMLHRPSPAATFVHAVLTAELTVRRCPYAAIEQLTRSWPIVQGSRFEPQGRRRGSPH